jgi:transposase
LTIATIIIEHSKRHLLKRLMKELYKKTKTATNQEVKWAKLTSDQRKWIAEKLAKFKEKLGSDVQFFCISVEKEKVKEHIRKDPNKLYNYMIKLLLSQELARFKEVSLNLDQRSIKVESGNSLHDYLQTSIWFDQGAETKLETKQCDSKHHLGVQLADILSGIVQIHFEDRKSDVFRIIAVHSVVKQLYF